MDPKAVERVLAQIIGRANPIIAPDLETYREAQRIHAEGVDRQRGNMHTGPHVQVSYPKGGDNEMANFTPIDPTTVAAPGAGGGMKYEALVKEFIAAVDEQGNPIPVATLTPDEGKKLAGLVTSVKAYLDNHPTVPAFVFTRKDADGNDHAYIARSDNDATRGWKPKERKPRTPKAVTSEGEAPQAAEGDAFEALEDKNFAGAASS